MGISKFYRFGDDAKLYTGSSKVLNRLSRSTFVLFEVVL